jgi:hypothetical protein
MDRGEIGASAKASRPRSAEGIEDGCLHVAAHGIAAVVQEYLDFVARPSRPQRGHPQSRHRAHCGDIKNHQLEFLNIETNTKSRLEAGLT